MGSRAQLHDVLKETLGSSNVYFQPPSTVNIIYPCIIYSRNAVDTEFANDIPYITKVGYQIKVIDVDPDSEIVKKVSTLPTCKFERHYTADNLNHDVYSIFY